jgi:hypothetical protein
MAKHAASSEGFSQNEIVNRRDDRIELKVVEHVTRAGE